MTVIYGWEKNDIWEQKNCVLEIIASNVKLCDVPYEVATVSLIII